MLQDVVHPPEQLPTDGISSPITAQILDFCDDGDIFSETLRNSEVSSCSGGGGAGSGGTGICCYDDVSLPADFSPFSSMDASALSAFLDSQTQPEPEPDIILPGSYPSSIHSTPPTLPVAYSASSFLSNPVPDHFDPASELSNINNPMNSYPSYSSEPSLLPLTAPRPQLTPPSLSSVFDNDCILSLSSYMGLDSSPASTSCPFMAPTMGGAFYTGSVGVTESGEGLGFYTGSAVVRADPVMAAQEVVDYQGETAGCAGGMGIYTADSLTHQRIYGTPCDLQVSGDHLHLVAGCNSPAAMASDLTSLDDQSSYKVGRISVQERKEKIHRYLKKKNERNFTKKIKYACRKTLADSRPRVRGRFAKNDEFGEPMKPSSSLQYHEEEDEEEIGIKEEEDMIDSSELYAHLSGLSSFKCSYTQLESWI